MMNNNELKNGDMCYVSDDSIQEAFRQKIKRRVVGYTESGAVVVENDMGQTSHWNYAVKIPKKKIIPWTLETVPYPLPEILDDGGNIHKAIKADKSGLLFGTFRMEYKALTDKDCKQRISQTEFAPCGMEVK